MSPEQVMALVNQIERTLPVAQWRIQGVQIWPIVRFRLLWAAFDESVGGGWARGGRLRRVGRHAASALRSAASAIRDMPRSHLLRSTSDAIIVTDGIAVTRIDGAAYDVIADPLTDLLHEAGATVNTWYTTYACPRDRKTEGVLIQWRLDAAQVGLARGRRAAAEPLSGYQEFLDKVRDAGLPHQAVALGRMSRLAARVAVMAECFDKWLREAAPRLVFVNCYYSLEGSAAMLACRRRGILSIDVQHGVQGEQHIAYGSWVNVPAAGYDLLPDRFWSWSEREAHAIAAWADEQRARHRALVGGNPWMEIWRSEQIPFVAAADAAVRTLKQSDTPAVLVTLQWGMNDEVFLDPLIELMVAAGTGWTWWIRLHPVMRDRRGSIKERLRERGCRNVWLDQPSDFALPALLKRADVHLTYNSSAVLEAAALGVPSVVSGPSAATYFADLIASGMAIATGGMQPERVIEALHALVSRRHSASVTDIERRSLSAVKHLLVEARSVDEPIRGAAR